MGSLPVIILLLLTLALILFAPAAEHAGECNTLPHVED